MAASTERDGPVVTRADTGDLLATGATDWLQIRDHMDRLFTAEVEGIDVPVGTFIVEARQVKRDADGAITFGATKTLYSSTDYLTYPQNGRLAGWWDVRVRCSAYTSGTYRATISQ